MRLLRSYYVSMHKLRAGPKWTFNGSPVEKDLFESGEEWLDAMFDRRLKAQYGHQLTGHAQQRTIVAQMAKELRAKARHAEPVVSHDAQASSAAT